MSPATRLILTILCWSPSLLTAQQLALKTNIPALAVRVPNLSIEVTLGPSLTLDVAGMYNPFQVSETKKWKLWSLQPEIRYWLCKPYSGTFIGLHGGVGQFNMGGIGGSVDLGSLGQFDFNALKEHRAQGSFWNAGLSIGRHWILSPRWGLEGTIGLGYGRIHYERFRCVHCGESIGSGNKPYYGPTRAALSLVYMIN